MAHLAVIALGFLQSCVTTLAQHHRKCVSKSPPGGVMCSTPRPDHRAARAAPQHLPRVQLLPVRCARVSHRTAVQASPPQQHQPHGCSEPYDCSPESTGSSSAPCSNSASAWNPPRLSSSRASPRTQSLLDPSSAAKLGATENLKGDNEEINQRTEEHIKQCLHRATARLCLRKFAVESVQLLSTKEDTQRKVLEGAHRMGLDSPSSCTCHFSQVLQLPCWHILAMLSVDRETLQLETLSREQQKGRNARQARYNSADGLLVVLTSSWRDSLNKSLVVSVLTGCVQVWGAAGAGSGTKSRCSSRAGPGAPGGPVPHPTGIPASPVLLSAPHFLGLGVEGAVWVLYLLSVCCLLYVAAEEPVWEPTVVTGNQQLTWRAGDMAGSQLWVVRRGT
ncbi:LOW QUALITY PROTEIN: zinc finger SWIM domain-containing protein 1 [Caloenas nicobarica]|uniref:LOW QUALITY PROTEIN: zinc finger SWIM domain-containing protein 1 n=1 Tax=Caloenas nicobarica TaxID=187106 RepID=UPI0032B7CBA3